MPFAARFGHGVIALGALLACNGAPARAESEAAAAIPDPVDVYYDGGDCGTEAIELQVFDRRTRRWTPHPEHPRVDVPSCRIEDAGRLLNELRWRCAPSSEHARPPWRNLAVFDSEDWARCTFERVLAEERARIREAQRKRLELVPEAGGEQR